MKRRPHGENRSIKKIRDKIARIAFGSEAEIEKELTGGFNNLVLKVKVSSRSDPKCQVLRISRKDGTNS